MILEVGKLNIGPIDSCSWGSGGKGKIADYVANKEPLDFAISHNSHNASHVTVFDDGSTYKFNCLPSSVSNPNVKVVIGADSALQVPKLLEEIKDWGLTEERLFIHPNAVVITEEHVRWEEENLGKIGSTMSGVGAARAAKLQRVGYKTVDQVPELSKFVCNTNKLVVEWLQHGKTGLLETAQGYDLSMDLVYDDADGRVNKFYPACTSRNINPTA
jgi:adenylosuccinate synthase